MWTAVYKHMQVLVIYRLYVLQKRYHIVATCELYLSTIIVLACEIIMILIKNKQLTNGMPTWNTHSVFTALISSALPILFKRS